MLLVNEQGHPFPGTTEEEALESPLDVIVIGAGFSGVCMGIQLLKAGTQNFLILEKASAVSGTWHDHTYPGLVCDIPSALYSYSFAPNPAWSRMFSPQKEIKAYIERCVRDFGLTPHLRLGTEITTIRFMQSSSLWRVQNSRGEVLYARVVVSATGGLRIPHIPPFAGREKFQGEQFHTARWPQQFESKNRRIALVGSAASAVQILPELAKEAEHIFLFQRTPNYIIPRGDRSISSESTRLFTRFPLVQTLIRWVLFLFLDLILFRSFKRGSRANRQRKKDALDHLRAQISNEELQKKLTPNYAIGCKRVLLSDDFYPALKRDNISLITESIINISKTGITISSPASSPLATQKKDTTKYEVDTIIYATGYDVANPSGPLEIEGPNGLSLKEVWANKMSAHRGVAVPGFPNFFLIVGPNSGLGHNSIVFIIEQQVNYIIKCIKRLKKGETMSPSQEATNKYNREIQSGFDGMVWGAGCKSWYMSQRGHNPTLWPYRSLHYWRSLRKPHFEEYEFTSPQNPLGVVQKTECQ